MTLIEDHMARAVEELKEDSFYDNADWECVLQLVPNFNNFQVCCCGNIYPPASVRPLCTEHVLVCSA